MDRFNSRLDKGEQRINKLEETKGLKNTKEKVRDKKDTARSVCIIRSPARREETGMGCKQCLNR